jgi:hypothetical protein
MYLLNWQMYCLIVKCFDNITATSRDMTLNIVQVFT